MATRVLVTGAAGVVGEETVAELVRRGDRYRVVALDRPRRHTRRRLRPYRHKIDIVLGDLCDPQIVARTLDGVDAVIHLASLIPPQADRMPEEASSVNLGGTETLIEAMERTLRPIRLLYVSSIAVYGDRLAQPWIEVGDPVRPSPNDHYGKTKVQAEEAVQRSNLPWTIFRLTGVMSHRLQMSPLMFHMPLQTKMEIITASDTGYALAQALEVGGMDDRIFNLGGGPRCRATFREVLDRYFCIMGLGPAFCPDEAFAEGNFHCGYYRDSQQLEQLLGFQREGLDEWFQQVQERLKPIVPLLAKAMKPLARWYLLSQSEPLAARRRGQHTLLERFCINEENRPA